MSRNLSELSRRLALALDVPQVVLLESWGKPNARGPFMGLLRLPGPTWDRVRDRLVKLHLGYTGDRDRGLLATFVREVEAYCYDEEGHGGSRDH